MIVNAILITFLGGLLTCGGNFILSTQYGLDFFGLWAIQVMLIFMLSIFFSEELSLVYIGIINYVAATLFFNIIKYYSYYVFDSRFFFEIPSPMVATLIIYGLLMITSITYMNYLKNKKNISKDTTPKNNL